MRKEQFGVGVLFRSGAENNDAVMVTERDSNEFVTLCRAAGAPTDALDGYAIGAEYTNITNGAKYVNTGTTASTTWTLIGTVAPGSVALADLATGITPSHIVIAAGKSTAEVDADASVVITEAGILAASDFAVVTLAAAANAVYVTKAVVTNDTITITLSGNGGAGTVVAYAVYRAAA